jgi:hypothetical protein
MHLGWKPLMLDGIAILCRTAVRRRLALAVRAGEKFVGKYGRRLKVARLESKRERKNAGSGHSEDSL